MTRLFDPGPAEKGALVEQIVELCESVLESGEFDSYEEGLKRIRRLCLRATQVPTDFLDEIISEGARDDPTFPDKVKAAQVEVARARSCGRDVCPPTSDCRVCQ